VRQPPEAGDTDCPDLGCPSREQQLRIHNRVKYYLIVFDGQNRSRLDGIVRRVKGDLARDSGEADLIQGVLHFRCIVRAGVFDRRQHEVRGVISQSCQSVRNLGLSLVILVLGAEGLYKVLNFRPRVLGKVVVGEESTVHGLQIQIG